MSDEMQRNLQKIHGVPPEGRPQQLVAPAREPEVAIGFEMDISTDPPLLRDSDDSEWTDAITWARSSPETIITMMRDLWRRVSQLEQELADRDQQLVKLRLRVREDDQGLEVSDGFGSTWPPCEKCGATLQVMRPGDARCIHCENDQYVDGLVARCDALQEALDMAQLVMRVVRDEVGGIIGQQNRDRLDTALTHGPSALLLKGRKLGSV